MIEGLIISGWRWVYQESVPESGTSFVERIIIRGCQVVRRSI